MRARGSDSIVLHKATESAASGSPKIQASRCALAKGDKALGPLNFPDAPPVSRKASITSSIGMAEIDRAICNLRRD